MNQNNNYDHSKAVAIIGGGPAGLMAAEILSAHNLSVIIYERKPSLGRKFLMAGRGGLNLTHSEELALFLNRYGNAYSWLAPVIERFPPDKLRAWCEGLGQPTFIGSSGRIFPESMKASPLLRAWQTRLEKQGVRFKLSRSWQGWDESGALLIDEPAGQRTAIRPAATLLALGGASWPRLGSDGGWIPLLEQKNIPVAPLRPSNCGFAVSWSDHFRTRHAGQPLKSIQLSFGSKRIPGELMITDKGIEGGAVYALSAALRDSIASQGSAILTIDLRPGVTEEALIQKLSTPRRRLSFSNFLRKAGGLSPVATALLQETDDRAGLSALDASALARLIKSLPLTLTAPFPIDRAISTAGGLKREAFDDNFMLRQLPGVFAAGEMLDWEAPTGGYLLQATFSTGVAAAEGILRWLTPGA